MCQRIYSGRFMGNTVITFRMESQQYAKTTFRLMTVKLAVEQGSNIVMGVLLDKPTMRTGVPADPLKKLDTHQKQA